MQPEEKQQTLPDIALIGISVFILLGIILLCVVICARKGNKSAVRDRAYTHTREDQVDPNGLMRDHELLQGEGTKEERAR